MLCVLLTKAGVSSAFNICYIITTEYFPLLYSSSVFGACNIVARIATIIAPLISEVSPPLPMIIYGGCCVASMAASVFLKKTEEVIIEK